MSDLAQTIKDRLANHDDQPAGQTLMAYDAAIRAVLKLCETEPSSLIDTDDLLEFVASALGVREDPEVEG